MTTTAQLPGEIPRLGSNTLHLLPPEVVLSDGNATTAGITTWGLHIGAGCLSTTLVAPLYQPLLPFGYGLSMASLRSPDVVRGIRDQGGMYLLRTSDRALTMFEVITSVCETIYAASRDGVGSQQLINRIASSSTEVITLTIAGGYHLGGDRSLSLGSRDVLHDLRTLGKEAPLTTHGYLVLGLLQRMRQDGTPVTIVPLDNGLRKGDDLRAGLEQFIQYLISLLRWSNDGKVEDVPTAQLLQALMGDEWENPQQQATFREELASRCASWNDVEALNMWMPKQVAILNAIADRISSLIDYEERRQIAAELGVSSIPLVTTEPTVHLVIEESPFPMPPWSSDAVVYVQDIDLAQRQKYHGLNGVHQIVAFLCMHLGVHNIHEGMENPRIRALVELAHQELLPAFPEEEWGKLLLYFERVRHRFHSVEDTVARVARDHTKKANERIAATIQLIDSSGGGISRAFVFALAVWLRTFSNQGRDQDSQPILVNDQHINPLLKTGHDEALRSWLEEVHDNPAMLYAAETLAALRQCLQSIGQHLALHMDATPWLELCGKDEFIRCIAGMLHSIYERGAEPALEDLLSQSTPQAG